MQAFKRYGPDHRPRPAPNSCFEFWRERYSPELLVREQGQRGDSLPRIDRNYDQSLSIIAWTQNAGLVNFARSGHFCQCASVKPSIPSKCDHRWRSRICKHLEGVSICHPALSKAPAIPVKDDADRRSASEVIHK
jgi:hypothetical protein